jgi:predicted RNA-binding protein YlxR (DUF448 family)
LTKKRSISPVKHIPQRSCVGCGQVRPKRELVRLVKVAGGGVEVDPSGKKSGRGAYLCPAVECWQAGLGKGRLDYVLRTRLSEENRERLMSLAGSWDKERAIG